MNDTDSTETRKEASLSTLPAEILEHIFSFLHRDDLLQAMSVCTTWKSLILSSRNLWRSQTFIFDCTFRPKKKTKVDMFYVAQNFGHHFQALTIKCRHRHMLHCPCTKMAEQFKLFLAGFKSPDLSSIKVSGLRMERTSNIAMSQVGRTLAQMFTKDCHLKVFEMTDAEWREPEGHKLLDTVFQKSRNTLETLNIAEYFDYTRGLPVHLNWFFKGLTSLTRLTKLSISIYYLSDELVVSLAQTRRGELAYLSLWATNIFWYFAYIRRDSWICLTEACPNIEVKLKMIGSFSDPHKTFPPFFEPLKLPVCRLTLLILQLPHPFGSPVDKMEIVLQHARNHFWERLKIFKLKVDNVKKRNFDLSLIKFMRNCPHLDNVKITARFHSGATVETIHKIIVERRQTPLTRDVSHLSLETSATSH